MSKTPQRVTRSMSHQPAPASPVASANTAPGPPVPARDTSTTLDAVHLSNPFHVDLVIPFDISLGKGDRAAAQQEVRSEYEALLQTLEGAGGLKIASKVPKGKKGKEEVWVFVGIGDEKVKELSELEQSLDQRHNLPMRERRDPPSPATRLRLLYNLLVYPTVQHGLGITAGEGRWKRVKSIAALHDEEADKAWIEKWTLGGDWRVGLLKGLGSKEGSGLGQHQPPAVHLYFNYLTSYTLSLLPLSLISLGFYFFTASESYPPLYAFILSLYSTLFVAIWRIRERKLAVRWGTRGSESVAVSRLRPEYVAKLGLDNQQASGEGAVDTIQAGNDLKRDIKIAASVPIIILCGVGLGVVLMGIFMLEAFVAQAYDGLGKQVVPLVPTGLFVLVVPQIVGAYQKLAKALVKWEDHPTPVGAEKSLTGKTFAMNGIVAYLGLFLSAYVYVPFGPYIMAHVQHRLKRSGYEGANVKFAGTPEKAGLGPKTSGEQQKSIKAGRLKGQMFAYTVTNQVTGALLENVLPYVLRFVDDWRAGKTTIKQAVRRNSGDKTPPRTQEEVEKRFMEKVERELALPEYNLFTDYAEMVTQFGYVTVWSIVWPLAPVFAMINNYIELRTDAHKICKHVRRPVGDRVETIGSWLSTLSIIAWIGAVTNATLIYLFRPSTTLQSQTPNPNMPSTGSVYLHRVIMSYDVSPTLQAVLPTLVPLAAIALAASHGFIILRWIIEGLTERVLWRGSEEEVEVQKIMAGARNGMKGEEYAVAGGRKDYGRDEKRDGGVFWNGGEEGARAIGSLGKSE